MKTLTNLFILMTALVVFFGASRPASGAPTTFYLIDDSTDSLYTVNSATGTATLVGPLGLGLSSISGVAYDPNSATLYYSGLSGVGLHSVDLGTGAATFIGNLAVNMPGLAYDAVGDILYGISGQTDRLYSIDPSNAVVTEIGPLGVNIARNGAAFDPVTGLLYMVNDGNERLYTVDPITGTALLVGTVGGSLDINALTFDASSGILYGASGITDSLYTLDPTTGAATLVGPLGVNVGRGIGLANTSAPVTDSDGDGVLDDVDFCPDSILTDTVIIDGIDTGVANIVLADGCSIADLVQQCAEGAKNHGAFVSCVAKLTNSLKKSGDISAKDKGRLQSAAGQSDIGK